MPAHLALVVSSKILIIPALYTFMLFAEMVLGPGMAGAAGVVFAFSPYIIYAHAGYTETLYFLLTTLGFIALHHRAWILSGLLGSLLSATRLVGVAFISSFAIYFKHVKQARSEKKLDYFLGLLLCPLGLATFMLFMYFHSGDALAFRHLQKGWGRSLANPLIVLVDGVRAGGWPLYFSFVVFFGLGIVTWLFYRRHFDHAVFLLLAILIPLTAGLSSIPRYIFWQMPFLFGVLDLVGRRKALLAAYIGFSSALSAFIILSWFVGMKSYVI